jgi:gliding motility-associated-like protein
MKYFIKIGLLLFILCFTVCKVNGQPHGTTYGSATVCAGAGNGFLTIDTTTSEGHIKWWQVSTDNGVTWHDDLNNTTPSYSYNDDTITTCYRVLLSEIGFPDSASSVSCITVYPKSIGGHINGAGTHCYVPGTGAGVLTLVADTGSVLYWQDSTLTSGWINIADSTTTLNYTNITHTTFYRAIVRNGATCPSDTSAIATFTFDSVTVAGTVATSDTVCPGLNTGTLHLLGNRGNVLNWLSSTNNGSSWDIVANTTTSQTYSGLAQTTWYQAVVKNGVCKTDTSGFAGITIVPNNTHAGNDTTIFLGESVKLNGIGNGIPLWSPLSGLDSIHKFEPIATPTISTLYILTVTDAHSCVSTDTVLVKIKLRVFKGVVSNLFTPNGDGINDTWYIQDIQNYTTNEVFIYNIYGNLIYTKKGYTNDWAGTYNGAELPDGTYYYVIRFSDSDALVKGSVDILRGK